MRLFARHSREWTASLACAALVAICLALANGEVRRDLFSVKHAMRTREVVAWTAEGEAMANEASGWVRAAIVSQGPLVIFGVASLVLVFLMLRL